MLEQYRTVRSPGFREVVIRKSRFIGHVMPVENEEEAVQFIENIKKQHWNATHNCSAYTIGERTRFRGNRMTGNRVERPVNRFWR